MNHVEAASLKHKDMKLTVPFRVQGSGFRREVEAVRPGFKA